MATNPLSYPETRYLLSLDIERHVIDPNFLCSDVPNVLNPLTPI